MVLIAISSKEMVRPCCHVYDPNSIVGDLTFISIGSLCIKYIDHLIDTFFMEYYATFRFWHGLISYRHSRIQGDLGEDGALL